MDAHVADPFPSVPPPSPRTPSVPPGLSAGMTIGDKYELVRKLGTGAMGEVWAARHKSLHEEVAIKLVMRNADHGDGTSAESRFHLEARVAAALSRKTRHIVTVNDHGHDGQLGYLVMELLEGESLDARIARTGPLPVADVAPIITQIARALSIAHAEGVVHRDLKASNVFVTTDEDGHAVAKVLDFGIAKLARSRGVERKAAHVTQRGFLLGTPAYMSPEQAAGKAIDHRADVWALGVIAYHMLTGEFPFESAAAGERFPELPASARDFFARAFARSIQGRFQSALALAAAFDQLDTTPRPMPPSPRPEAPPLHTDFVAGVPSRRKLALSVSAVVLLASVLIATLGVLGVYFESEPARAVGLSPRASTVTTNAPVPSPEPPAEKASAPYVISTDDLPTAFEAQRAPSPSRVIGIAGIAPVAGASRSVTAAPVARAARGPIDKSEVF